jgi:DNA-binding MarR family transcriptional regulator
VLCRPELDRIFDILSHHNRRLVLVLLQENATTTEADVMCHTIRDKHSVQVSLIHNHLPKLEEAGYIEWDRDSTKIWRGPQFNEIEPILELIGTYTGALHPD